MAKKKTRKRSKIRKMQAIIDRTATSLEARGIQQHGRATVNIGGLTTHQWQRPKQ